MELYENYDVIVGGAGITGVIAAISAAKEGAKVVLVERSNIIGGMITGGRVTKPTGEVKFGIFRDILERAANMGGATLGSYRSYWGRYSGIFDPETIYRIIIEFIENYKIDVLLNYEIVDAITEGHIVRGIVIRHNKTYEALIGKTIIDATGDGSIAAFAGAEYSIGTGDSKATQPISAYVRVLNVDFPRFANYCLEHPEDVRELVLPDKNREQNKSYVLNFFMTGLTNLIKKAKEDGFKWNIPKNHITMKAGLIEGEMNINATRFHGNALDPRVLSKAELELRKQAYTVFDFLRKYVPGFENAIFLEMAPRTGIRETRRIIGDYILTKFDILKGEKFEDSIGYTNSAIDIHEPNSEETRMMGVGNGYSIPFRCLLPKGIENLIVAGRCISVDEVAFGSVRNTPVCAITGEAAGVAAALSAKLGVKPRYLPIKEIQNILLKRGFKLGKE